jgi:hypothetical protein
MKGVSSTLLALVFVAFSLLSLMRAERSSEEALVSVQYDEAKVSELGLQFALQRYIQRVTSPISSRGRAKSRSTRAKSRGNEKVQTASFSTR